MYELHIYHNGSRIGYVTGLYEIAQVMWRVEAQVRAGFDVKVVRVD